MFILYAGEIVQIIEQCSKFADESDGLVAYEELLDILQSSDSHVLSASEGPDAKVVEFMRILEEYRVKCEDEGNYLEAGRAHKQLQILRIQEEKRQQKAIKVRQITERQDVQVINIFLHFQPKNDFYFFFGFCIYHSSHIICNSVTSMAHGTSIWKNMIIWPKFISSK